MNDIANKPAPTPSEMSQPFWDGVEQGELRMQTCSECGTPRHYPRLLCSVCYSDGVVWKTASRQGKVHSWTVAHHPYHPAFVTEVPYTLVVIDLDEGPRAIGRWDGDTPVIGQPVTGHFVAREGGSDLVFAASGI
jgi:uncharacterized protein